MKVMASSTLDVTPTVRDAVLMSGAVVTRTLRTGGGPRSIHARMTAMPNTSSGGVSVFTWGNLPDPRHRTVTATSTCLAHSRDRRVWKRVDEFPHLE
jgi:hypothetical protein